MDKESATTYSQVLADAATAIRALTAERDKLASENETMKRRREAEKLASAMHDKSISLDVDRETLVDHLEKEAEQGNLPEIQRAVDMVAPNMGIKIAHVSDETHHGVGASDFERWIMGDVER
jgi:predicted transcriptional regulator